MLKRLLPLACLSLLVACGGGSGADDSAHQRAVALAVAKEAEARSLGADSPCERVQQCGSLSFLQPVTPCPNYLYQPYSLVAPTAGAASAAAAEQRTLASQANALAPPSNIACPAVVNPVPLLACTAGRCRAAS